MTTATEQGTHCWHMSFLARNEIGLTAQDRSGHWTPTQGMTRFDAMNEIRRQVVGASPYLADAAMLSFDIQPNTL
ncbi:hypothetical protein [Streptomyces acidicola]|uniref:Uncharacterized protein n=1 Tax=Streptomyces acidicola TaxID=2596892 RepID=A0A5N8WJ87_9ACTN|nr:hypothetical protein [Streptomyces acidicola]MPY47180.1 hypothetical protein [Streptomyces acidicola]MPY47319.1 hypothetical protein [Streptomyces acidicola]